MVLFSNEAVDYDLEKGPGSICDEVNSFVHQSGLYFGCRKNCQIVRRAYLCMERVGARFPILSPFAPLPRPDLYYFAGCD